MIETSRRSLFAGLGALIVAPAVVRAASLMPVSSAYNKVIGQDWETGLLSVEQITREAVKLFRNSNAFIKDIDRQYDSEFSRNGAKIGQTLRIRLPNDYYNFSQWSSRELLPQQAVINALSEIPLPVAAALGAAAVAAKNPVVSRRFWK